MFDIKALKKSAVLIGLCVAAALPFSSLYAQNDFSKIEISSQQLTSNIYMLQGEGGNVAVFTGEDGVFIIDDQYAELTSKIVAKIKTITDQPIKYLVNTHWHFDHAGGNNNFGQAGVTIVAHDNVRERLLAGAEIKAFNLVVPPAPKAALPVITFTDEVTFHWNNDTVKVEHVEPAHTDGDAIIYFKRANVVHTGDLYFNGLYPFVDASSGGSAKGMIDGVARILANIDEQTKIIPGHGELSNKAELQAYHDMLKTVCTRIKLMKQKGKTLEAIIAAKPTSDYDAIWGKGFLSADKWVALIYSVI